jgi:hypothetical protein
MAALPFREGDGPPSPFLLSLARLELRVALDRDANKTRKNIP